MKRRAALALAIAMATQARVAFAIDVSANLGVGGAHTDAWGNGQRASSNSWDYEGDISLSGSVLRPGLFDWLLAANYIALRTAQYTGFSRDEAFGGTARVSMFGGSALPVSLSGSRTWSNFLSQSTVARTGETVTDNLGGSASFMVRGYPGVRLSLTHVDTKNVSLGGDTQTTGAENLAIGLSHSLPNQSYQLDFATGWNRGSFSETNFHSSYLTASVESTPVEQVRLRINEHYYLRDPSVEAWNNPRYEDSTLSTGLQWRPSTRFTASVDYTYHHLLVRVFGQPSIEDLSHAIGAGSYYRISPRLAIYGNLAATYDHQHGSTGDALNAGESGGAGLTWSHTFGALALSAGGGGTTGVIESANGNVTATYGGTAGAGAGWGHMWPGVAMQSNATYTGSYVSGGAAGMGWKLTQRVLLAADEAVGGKVTLRHLIDGSIVQQDGGMLGMLLSRSVSLSSALGYKSFSLAFSGGISDSLSEALAEPVPQGSIQSGAGGGLAPTTPTAIPLGQQFNTFTMFASVAMNQGFGKLRFMEVARTLRTEAPGREPRWERAAGITVSYELGAFYLSLDDHLTVGGTGSVAQNSNLIMARLTRSFGARFF